MDAYDGLASIPGLGGDEERARQVDPPLPYETPDQTAARQAGVARQAQADFTGIQRFKAGDFAQRGIPAYMDQTGAVQPFTDATGAPVTKYDAKAGIGWDSSGQPVAPGFDESGQPKLSDPFAGLTPITDKKTGDQYKIRNGLPWQWTGQDPDIAAANLQKDQDRAVAQESSALGRKLSLNEAQTHRDEVEFKHRDKAFASNFGPIDYDNPDDARKQLESSFDEQYKSPEASKTGWFDRTLTPEAQQVRAGIDANKAKALQTFDGLVQARQNLDQKRDAINATTAQREALEQRKIDVAMGKARASGVIPGLDDASDAPPTTAQGTSPAAPVGQPSTDTTAPSPQDQGQASQSSPSSTVIPGLSEDQKKSDDPAQHLAAAAAGQKPYLYDQKNGLQFTPDKLTEGLDQAVKDGVVDPDWAKRHTEAFKAAQDKFQDLQKAAGSAQVVKALLHGGGMGAAFLAGAAPGAAGGAEIGGAVGSAVPGAGTALGAGIGSVLGGLATGTLAAFAARKGMEKLGEYSDAIKSLNAAAELHPVADAAGELVSFAASAPRAIGKLARLGSIAKAGAIGEGATDIAGNIAGAKAIGGQLAKGAVAGAAFEAVARPAFDAARYVVADQLGIQHDDLQAPTVKSLATNVALGVLTAGHSVEFRDYSAGDIASLLTRAKVRSDAGIPLDKDVPVPEIVAAYKAKGVDLTNDNLQAMAAPLTREEIGLHDTLAKQTQAMEDAGAFKNAGVKFESAQQAVIPGLKKGSGTQISSATIKAEPNEPPAAATPAPSIEGPTAPTAPAEKPVKGKVVEPPPAPDDLIAERDDLRQKVARTPQSSTDAALLTAEKARLANVERELAATLPTTETGVTPGNAGDAKPAAESPASPGGAQSPVPQTSTPDATGSADQAQSPARETAAGPPPSSEPATPDSIQREGSSTVDTAAHEAATSPQNDLTATPAQIEGNNAKLGHVNVGGLNVSIEHPAGTARKEGWSPLKGAHYGYLKGSTSGDGENMDAFVKEGTPTDYSGPVYVVNRHPAGKGVDHKVVIGADSAEDALKVHNDNYPAGLAAKPEDVATFSSTDSFKKWATGASRRTAPAKGDTKPAPEVKPVIPGLEEDPALTKLREKHRDVLSELQAAQDAQKAGFGDEDTDAEIGSLSRVEKKLRDQLAKHETRPTESPQSGAGKPAAPADAQQPAEDNPAQPGDESLGAEQRPSSDRHTPESVTTAVAGHVAAEAGDVGVTVRPTKEGDGAIHAGIGLNLEDNHIIHDGAELARQANHVDQEGGDGAKWLKSASDEEVTHHLQVRVAGQTFDAKYDHYWKLMKPIQEAARAFYSDTTQPRYLAAEVERAMDQLRRGVPLPESLIPGNEESAAKFVEALKNFDMPHELAANLDRIAMARAGKAEATPAPAAPVTAPKPKPKPATARGPPAKKPAPATPAEDPRISAETIKLRDELFGGLGAKSTWAAPVRAKASPVSVPAILSPAQGDLLKSKYRELVARTGFPAVMISELAKQTGIPLPKLKEQLAAERLKGNVALSTGDWSLSTEEQRAGVMDIPAIGRALQVRYIPQAIGASQPNRSMSNGVISGPGRIPMALGALSAYHGTPHKVDKFSMDKVGTGEGAQVYGHGLYFAENPEVAKAYLGAGQDYGTSVDAHVRAITSNFDGVEGAKRFNDEKLAELKSDPASKPQDIAFREKVASALNGGRGDGNTYTVHLDVEPEELLDWDGPLSEQSEKVKAALRKALPAGVAAEIDRSDTNLDGSSAYNWAGKENDDHLATPQERSAALRAAGIPGIRYADAGSRSEKEWLVTYPNGEGFARYKTQEEADADAKRSGGAVTKNALTSNYVIFDDSKIKITHENGQPVTREERAMALGASTPGDKKLTQQQSEALLALGKKFVADIEASGEDAKPEDLARFLNSGPHAVVARPFTQRLWRIIGGFVKDEEGWNPKPDWPAIFRGIEAKPVIPGIEEEKPKSLQELEAERREISNRHIWNNAMSKGARPAPPDTRAIDDQIDAAREREGKQFWQRTKDQVAHVLNMPEAKHRQYVEKAITEGKTVPANVLADYPDLAPEPPVETAKVKVASTGNHPAPAKQEGITDFGEKIYGAKKDLWGSYKKAMTEALPEDAAEITLSKNFPEPDYELAISQGVPVDSLAIFKAIRDMIPPKPRKSYRLRGWADLVKTLHGFMQELVTSTSRLPQERFNQLIDKSGLTGNIGKKIEFYQDLGFPAFTKAADWGILDGVSSLIGGTTREYKKVTMASYKDRLIGAMQSDLPGEEGRKAVLKMVKEKLMAEKPPEAKKAMEFNIYSDRLTKDVFIGKKATNGVVRLKTGFSDVKLARAYLADNQQALEEQWNGLKAHPDYRRPLNAPRQGPPRREGDVSPEQFHDAFGFRGVQFGNYVEGDRRQQDINEAFDALMDLADVLGVPPKALSLDGSLGLAFGARGSGGTRAAAAHYEPGQVVINLTKKSGPGALGHEWFHGFDNYFARLDKTGETKAVALDRFATSHTSPPVNMRAQVYAAFQGIRSVLSKGGFAERSKELDKARTEPYYSTTIEKAARAFERYIVDKMAAKGVVNDYLVNLADDAEAIPTKAEMASGITQAYDQLFNALDTKPTERGVALGASNPLRMKVTRDALIKAAEESSDWKDWYERHEEALREYFGPNADLFQTILSATSQAASVKANVGLALKAYVQLKTGAPFEGFLPAVIGNLERIRNQEQLQGQKISAYDRANVGEKDSVVVDRHIARLLFGVDSPSRAQFAKAQKVLTEVADRLGWEPRQVMAALWAASIRKSGKTPESYDGRLRTLKADGTLDKRLGDLVFQGGKDSLEGGGRPSERSSAEDSGALAPGALGAAAPFRDAVNAVAQEAAAAKAALATAPAKDAVVKGYDATGTIANQEGVHARHRIRLDYERPKQPGESRRERLEREKLNMRDLQAARLVEEAGGDVTKIESKRAELLAKTPVSKEHDSLIKGFLPIYDHAIAHADDLYQKGAGHRILTEGTYNEAIASGEDYGRRENYVRRVTQAPPDQNEFRHLFQMGSGQGSSPRDPQKHRVFDTIGDAILANHNPGRYGIHESDQNMVENHYRILGQKAFVERFQNFPAPSDGKPVIGALETVKNKNGQTETRVPEGYRIVQINGAPRPVHKELAPLFSDLYGSSAIRQNVAGRALLKFAAFTKSYTLVGDTFHLGRVGIKKVINAGFGPSIELGRALTNYADADLGRAVSSGEISQKAADYAKAKRPLFDDMLKQGLNVGKVADNLMEQARAHVPGFGKLNDYIFNDFSRNYMTISAVAMAERNLAAKGRFATREEAIRQAAKEANEQFGNLQNQGIFTNKTLQDLSRIMLLAPQWTEAMARTEGRAYAQFGKTAYRMAATKGKDAYIGNSARALAIGFAAFLAVNQLINYLTRGHSTFENKEDGHSLDAWIPGGKRGFFFSPWEIVAEYMHAASKYFAQHEHPVDIATHIARNKLSPLAHGALEAATGRDGMGRHYLNNTDRFRGAAMDALPSPLPLGALVEKDPRQPLGYRANRAPGALEKQALQSIGAKVTPAQSPRTQMFAIAQPYRADGGKTDAAGPYTELRRALDNSDQDSARSEIQWLQQKQGKTLEVIGRALGIKKDGGVSLERFTGSDDGEKAMLAHLTPAQRAVYQAAQQDHLAIAHQFQAIAKTLPRETPKPKAKPVPLQPFAGFGR